MTRLYSNGVGDFVLNPFNKLIQTSSQLSLAAPYFTMADPIVRAANGGKLVQLLVGLNAATSPQALAATHGLANLAVRYLTHRFHAKIYVFDTAALVGSSNLTDGGMLSNREATVQIDDLETLEEIRALFVELWDSALVLTTETLAAFRQAHSAIARAGPDPDTLIEQAVGKAAPPNIDVRSRTKTGEQIFLQELRRQVYEQYRPAFSEVNDLLVANAFRLPELSGVGEANETNRFLNWVRLTHAPGDDSWQGAPLRDQASRRTEILALGDEWSKAERSHVPDSYVDWLERVQRTFGTTEAIDRASKDELSHAFTSLHAFAEQLRFVKGGLAHLPAAFWEANGQDVAKVKHTLRHLVHGSGDFIVRLHDVLYDPKMKLRMFGRFSALELFGTLRPELCPPMNGRMAKALRFLGFDVRGS
ncbi:MAG TPA: phospholipase D family protein [Fimbriimonadaceae bacterium]|nr:phospholipase D family protein [Fimbriimonadaceae bacterium]